jgi:hypothetical protein
VDLLRANVSDMVHAEVSLSLQQLMKNSRADDRL